MKIERINDMQIRCTLSNFDLSVRNLNLSELAYGSEKAHNLFREMIQKASNEVGFETENIPLMVEAIPLSNESVMLLITKVEDPEEMDTRFSRFSPVTDVDFSLQPEDPAEAGLEGADQLSDKRQPKLPENDDKTSRIRIFMFRSLDQVMDAASAVKNSIAVKNTLYKNPGDHNFYLIIENTGDNASAFASTCNMLAEYGKRIRQTYSSDSYYREHYELILPDHALQALAKIG